MKLTLFALACAILVGVGAIAGDCDNFHLGQMRLGDSREATAARWPGKWKKEKSQYLAKVPDIRKTRVDFDAAGTIAAVRMDLGNNPAKVKLALLDRFGPPTADSLQVPVDLSYEIFAGPLTHVQTRWDSEECNVDAILNVVSGASPGVTITSVFAALVRHGATPSK